MRNRFFAVLGVAGTLMLAACSSSDEGKPGAKGDTASSSNIAAGAASPNSGNSNTNVVANGSVVLPQAADANVIAGDPSATPFVPPQLQNRLDKLRKGGVGSGPPVDAAALAMKNARPAPDNSTFTSFLTDAGYEIRSFKNHPQLQRVEKRTSDDGNVTIKVFLRGGKVIELPGQRIPVLFTASAAQISEAAGLPASTMQTDPGSTGAKKAN